MSTYILQIDTATEVCSVSLSLDGQVIHKMEATEPNLHASKLTVFIDELLRNAKWSYADLSAVAVSKGPGSYTGLRIGVSTAKGLCYALDIPLLAVNTLASMFKGYASTYGLADNSLYVPMLDARRMEVYMMVYNHHGEVLQPTEAVIMDVDTFQPFANQKIILFGSGALKLKDLYSQSAPVQVDTSYKHSSSYLAESAFEKFEKQDFEDLIYFEPFYLKEFIATTPKAK